MPSLHVKHLQTWRHDAANPAPGFHPKEDSRGNLPVTQELFPDLVRQSCVPPMVEGGGEGERRRKEKESMEAQGDAGGDDGGGGERIGGDIQEVEGSCDRDPNRTDSSEDEAAADETRRRMKTRCQDEWPCPDGEGDGDFEDEDERGVP